MRPVLRFTGDAIAAAALCVLAGALLVLSSPLLGLLWAGLRRSRAAGSLTTRRYTQAATPSRTQPKADVEETPSRADAQSPEQRGCALSAASAAHARPSVGDRPSPESLPRGAPDAGTASGAGRFTVRYMLSHPGSSRDQ